LIFHFMRCSRSLYVRMSTSLPYVENAVYVKLSTD
jgi:hypothetical protein